MTRGLHNATPFAALAPPLLDSTGRRVATLILKGTFAIGRDGRARLHDAQAPVRPNDVPHDPAQPAGSVRYPADLAPAKVGADVVVVGEAIAARPSTVLDIAVKVQGRSAPLRVHGPRVYFASVGRVAVGPAAPVERVPIVYEKAYGGVTDDYTIVERRNPVGVGVARRPADLDGRPAPQIEHPGRPITAAGDAPEPAGFGAIAPHWSPRAERAGTRDAAWRDGRMPLPPADFDVAYNNVAHPSLRLDAPLRPGEEIAVLGMTLDGLFRFDVPAFPVRVRACFDGRAPAEVRPAIDTLLIEPLAAKIEITARASFPVGRGREALRELRVDLHEAA